MVMNLPFNYYFHQATQDHGSLIASLGVATVALAALLALRSKRLRDSYPDYRKIPSTILTHMASKKELHELDNEVDVIVR